MATIIRNGDASGDAVEFWRSDLENVSTEQTPFLRVAVKKEGIARLETRNAINFARYWQVSRTLGS